MTRDMICIVQGIMLAAAVLMLGGCSKDEGAADEVELVVLCGSSFAKPMEAMVEKFTAETGVAVVTTVGESEDLLPHVKAQRQGDVFITHDPYLDYVRKAGALADHAEVGILAPVLVVQKGNPKGIKRIEDLVSPGLRVAFSNPQYSTCGEMVERLLVKKGIKEAVMKNVGNRLTKGHSKLGTFMQTDVVDAVIMWNGVARVFELEVVQTPYEYDTEIRVHVMGLSYSRYPEAVRRFVKFAEREGGKIFAEFGYVK